MKAHRALWIQDVDRAAVSFCERRMQKPDCTCRHFPSFGHYATWFPFRTRCGIARRSLKGDAMECHILVLFFLIVGDIFIVYLFDIIKFYNFYYNFS